MDGVLFNAVNGLNYNKVSKYTEKIQAAEAINKGDIVGILDEKLKKYKYLISECPQSWTPFAAENDMVMMGNNKFLAITGSSAVMLFKYDPVTYVITYLNQVGGVGGGNGKCDIAYLTDTIAAILDCNSSTGRISTITINPDNTLTHSATVDLSSQLGNEMPRLIYLGGRKLFACGVSSGTSYYIVPVVIEYDETYTTPTFTVGYYNGVAHHPKAVRLADDKFLMSFSDGDNGSRLTFVIGTVTGTAIAWSGVFYVTDSTTLNRNLFVWDTNKVLVSSGSKIVSLVCDTVANTVTIVQNIALSTFFPTSFASVTVSSLAKIDATTLLMGVVATINSVLGIYLCKVKLDTVANTVSPKSYRNVKPLIAGSVKGATVPEIFKLGSAQAYLIGHGKPCVVIPPCESDWAIAIEDGNADDMVEVQFEGVVDAFSGLKTGWNYYSFLDNSSIVYDPSVALGYDSVTYIGTAISDTTLKLVKTFGGDRV